MKIRTGLEPEEHEEEFKCSGKRIITFYGSCHGVRLFTRGPNDPHVMFQIITEDDGYWFESRSGQSSSFWLPEVISLLNHSKRWMENNCSGDGEFGWKVK